MARKIVMNALIAASAGGLLGLAAGYLLFGKIAGEYVSLTQLFSFSHNILEGAVRSLAGIEAMRTKILMCGAAGAIAGVVARLLLGSRR